jgi:hypothetical protein
MRAYFMFGSKEELRSTWQDVIEKLPADWATKDLPRRWAATRASIYVGEYCRSAREIIAQWQIIATAEEVLVEIPVSREISLRLSNPLRVSLTDAMVTFFLNIVQKPTDELRPIIESSLEGLRAWAEADEKRPDQPNLGLFRFLQLSKLFQPNAPEEAARLPLLLTLVDPLNADSPYRRTLAWLFIHGSRHRDLVQETFERLRTWLVWVNGANPPNQQIHEQRLHAVLGDIVEGDPSRQRMSERLCSYLQRWANHSNQTLRLPAAQRALQYLAAQTQPPRPKEKM